MAKQLINTGASANDNTGDSLRQGATKINSNFNEIYSLLGNGTTLLSRDISLINQKILFSNEVETLEDLNTINGLNFVGCIIYVKSQDSLYFSSNGTWRKLLIDISDDVSNNYVSPLSSVAYSGNLTDLGIDDGVANQVLVSNGDRTFSFKTLESIISGFDGDYNNLTNKPNLSAVAISGSYNDLTNRPTIPTDLNQFTDLSNLLFSGSYNDLTNRPTIPTDITQLTDASGVLFDGNYNSLTNLPVLFSGSYNDLTNKPLFANVAVSGNFVDLINKPAINDLTDVNTSGVTNGQTLVYNTGTWGPGNLPSIGNFSLSSSTIDTDDSSAISIVPSVVVNSDLTVENDLTVNNLLTVTTLQVAGDIQSSSIGTPELYSETDILLTAVERVSISQSPLKLSSFTTSQRDALTPENGDMIYNTTANKFQGYANGLWVDLH